MWPVEGVSVNTFTPWGWSSAEKQRRKGEPSPETFAMHSRLTSQASTRQPVNAEDHTVRPSVFD